MRWLLVWLWRALPACVLVLLSSPATARPIRCVEEAFPVRVDPRVELVMTIFRLGGADEFNGAESTSAYTRALDAYFAPYSEHPAVRAVARLRRERSIGFDAVPALAVHLKDIDSFEFVDSQEAWPGAGDDRWDPASAHEFAALARDFARDTRYVEFLASQREFIESVERGLGTLLATRPFRSLIEGFFGESIARGLTRFRDCWLEAGTTA